MRVGRYTATAHVALRCTAFGLGAGYCFPVLLIFTAAGQSVSGIWFHGVSFLPFVLRHTGVGALAGLMLWRSRGIMGCQDGS